MDSDYIQAVEGLYNSDPQREWNRLERHRTEYAVTRRVLAEHLPPAPARILDCGGGPGRYAIELSKQGYAVTLFDLSPALLDIARARSADAGIQLESIEQGSATDLSRFEENSFDAVLLMGPLYHLLSEENRRLALEQAYRVAKPGAPIFAAFINRYAAHRDCAADYPDLYLGNREEYEGILEHGRTFPMEGKQNFVAYFAHPSEIEPLCRGVGLESIELVGLEGLASMVEEKLNALQGESWDAWVDINYTVGRDRWAMGNTEHILAVCRKPKEQTKARLIIMAGLPGTGKSTIAQALAEQLDALVLDKDSIRAALFPPALVEYSREQDDLCMDVMLQVAAWHLRKQRNVILDGRTYSHAYQRQRVEQAAQTIPVRTQWILCTCDDDLAQQRLATDHASGAHPAKNRTPELYAQVKAHYAAFTLPHLVLNTDQPVGRCVQTCLDWLKAGQHGAA